MKKISLLNFSDLCGDFSDFLKFFGGVVKAAVYKSVRTFSGEKCLGEIIFHKMFQTWEETFKNFAEVSCKVVEAAMHVSSWINWWKIIWTFIHHFGILGETLSSVSRKFSGEVVKTAFLKYRGLFYWKRFLLGKIVSSLFCRLERLFLEFLLRFFWRGGQNCKLHLHWNLLREDIYLG